MRDRRTQHAVACAVVYVVIVALYAPTLGYAPIGLDDRSQLAHVAGKGLGALLWEGDRFGHFRPLKNLLFAWMAGEPARVAVVRGALLAVLLGATALVQRVTLAVTGARWVALATAALWALHPVTAGAVAWLSTANLVIALLLMLAYLTCCARDAWPAALGALALALSAHELAVVAPLLGAAYLHALGRPPPRVRGPMVLGSLLVVGGYAVLQLVRAAPTDAYRTDAPAWLSSLSAARYALAHVAMWLWPRGQLGVLLTDRPEEHVVASIACWVALLGAAAAWWWLLRGRDRAVDLALGWSALTLLPVCNLVPIGNTPVALHYLLVPGVGLALALAAGAARVLALRAGQRVVLALGAAALIALLWLPETARTVAAWEGEEALYLATLANHPDEVEVLSNLASIYLGKERFDAARPLLAHARALAPHAEGVLVNLFALELATGRGAAALALLDAHPELDARPEFAIRRGEALELIGRDAEAAAAFARGYEAAGATGQREQRYIGGYRRIVALLRLGRQPEAEALLARMLAEFPEGEELQIARRLLEEE